MTKTKQTPAQGAFLEVLRDRQVPVHVFLVNGIKLQGKVRSFDSYVVVLAGANGDLQTVYKHSISTVVPTGRG